MNRSQKLTLSGMMVVLMLFLSLHSIATRNHHPAQALPVLSTNSAQETNHGSKTESSSTREPIKVLAYYTKYYDGDVKSYNALTQYGSYLTEVSTMTFNVSQTGSILGSTPTNGVQLAKSKRIETYAAIANQAGDQFNGQLAHTVLSNSEIRQSVIHNIEDLLKQNGYSGANIDFENMQAADRSYFTQFVQDLANALHADGFTLIVSVMPKTSDAKSSAWTGAFDYASLGQAADQIQVMTYDEHDPTGKPGAVAGLPWVEAVLNYAVSQIPASKLLLGLPAYGYDWNQTTGKGNKSITWKKIPDLLASIQEAAQFDSSQESPFFTYNSAGNEHVVWYENADSIEMKTKLVSKYHLAGVSMWDLGLEDDGFWKAVEAGLAGS